MKYVYQRTGGPLLSWRNGPPQSTRASDAKALGCSGCGGRCGGHAMGGLGSLGGTSLEGPTIELPRAGAPEPLPMGGLMVGDPSNPLAQPARSSSIPTPVLIGAGALAAFLLYKKYGKKK